MAVNYKPLSAEHGFKSPGFTVDDEGNIAAKSISLASQADTSNFVVTNSGTTFIINDETGNPGITIIKGETYQFTLTLDSNADFNIYERPGVLYSNGLQFVDIGGDVFDGASAQGKRQGTLTFKVPVDAPDRLFYANGTFTSSGIITVTLPTVVGVGIFEQLTVTGTSLLNNLSLSSTTESSSTTTGGFVLAGGAGIAKDVNIGGSITSQGAIETQGSITAQGSITSQGSMSLAGSLTVGDYLRADSVSADEVETFSIVSTTDLAFNADNEISIQIGSSQIGTIDAQGLILDIRNSSAENMDITNSSINNTTIGLTTPSTASFTSATVSSEPVDNNDITNKDYVDTQDIAFSIAFGL